MKFPRTRDQLLAFLESVIVHHDDWKLNDSAEKVKKYGAYWALLKSGAPFEVYSDEEFTEKFLDKKEHKADPEQFWVHFPTVPIDNSLVMGDSYCFSIREKDDFNRLG